MYKKSELVLTRRATASV